MNIKKIRNYQIFSVIFTFILGSLLHFTYKLSGEISNGFVIYASSDDHFAEMAGNKARELQQEMAIELEKAGL